MSAASQTHGLPPMWPCLDEGARHNDRWSAMNSIEDAIRTAGATIEKLVRAIVRDELRRHLGPEADHFINVNDAPMKASKLRRLIRTGELRGYKHGRDVLVAASDLRAFIEGRPVEPPRPIPVREPPPLPNRDLEDDVCVTLGIVPKDPAERRAFEARLAQRRAEGGERAASLRRAEEEGNRLEDNERRKKERAAKRAATRAQRQP